MAELGTLANAFSVVGLADVVCRASIQLYDLIQGLRHAPARQQRYLGILRPYTHRDTSPVMGRHFSEVHVCCERKSERAAGVINYPQSF